MAYIAVTYYGIEIRFRSIKDVYKYGRVFPDISTVYKEDDNGGRIDITAEYSDNLL